VKLITSLKKWPLTMIQPSPSVQALTSQPDNEGDPDLAEPHVIAKPAACRGPWWRSPWSFLLFLDSLCAAGRVPH
jgi:hypothetical protein